MPRNPRHIWDDVADEVVEWLDGEASYYADAILDGHQAPFAAEVTQEQQREYYARQVFETKPDGTPDYTKPNTKGREMLIQRLGINGYIQVMSEVMPDVPSSPLRDSLYDMTHLDMDETEEPPGPSEMMPPAPAPPGTPDTASAGAPPVPAPAPTVRIAPAPGPVLPGG